MGKTGLAALGGGLLACCLATAVFWMSANAEYTSRLVFLPTAGIDIRTTVAAPENFMGVPPGGIIADAPSDQDELASAVAEERISMTYTPASTPASLAVRVTADTVEEAERLSSSYAAGLKTVVMSSLRSGLRRRSDSPSLRAVREWLSPKNLFVIP